jgi:hypothetical protein
LLGGDVFFDMPIEKQRLAAYFCQPCLRCMVDR